MQCYVHLLACQLQSGVYTVSTEREEGGVGVKLCVHNVHFISESDADTSVHCYVHLLACQLQSGVYTVATERRVVLE